MASAPGTIIGRYALFDRIASGGMGSVHLGRQIGLGGFARTVAIKRLHPHLAADPELVGMFLDEARIAARIRHANVVTTLDVAAIDGELILVMDYILGDALSAILGKLRESGQKLPLSVVSTIICEALYGLHAAHEAKDERGEPLGIIHRDISPHNLLVGVDGVTRVVDFGVAKAEGRIRTTLDAGAVRGKLSYMALEQLFSLPLDRRADIYSMGVVLWEALAARRYNDASSQGAAMHRAIHESSPSIREYVPDLPDAVEEVLQMALHRDKNQRFETAEAMALALGAALPQAPPPEVGKLVQSLCEVSIRERAALVSTIESASMQDTSQLSAGIRSGVLPSNLTSSRDLGADAPPPSVLTAAETPEARNPFSATTVVTTPGARAARLRLTASLLILGLGAFGIYQMRGNQAKVAMSGFRAPTFPLIAVVSGPAPSVASTATSVASTLPSASSLTSSSTRSLPSVTPSVGPRPPGTQPTPSLAPRRPCEYYENGIKMINPECLK